MRNQLFSVLLILWLLFLEEYEANLGLFKDSWTIGAIEAERAVNEVVVPSVTATDYDGNTYIAGHINLKFTKASNGSIGFPTSRIIGYISKKGKNGDTLWTRSVDTTGDSVVLDLHLDNRDNLYIVGEFSQSMRIEGLSEIIKAKGKTEMFIAKLEAEKGKPLWIRNAGFDGYQSKAKGVSTDRKGNAYVIGEFEHSIQFKNETEVYNSVGGFDVFVAKYNSKGNLLWVNTGAGFSDDEAIGIASNERRNCIVGYYNINIYFGNGNLMGVPGRKSVFVAQYDTTGTAQWNLGILSPQIGIHTIATDDEGYCYMVGIFKEEIQIANYPKIAGPKGASVEFMTKFDHYGKLIQFKSAHGIECGRNCQVMLAEKHKYNLNDGTEKYFL
jgi:hypothetical protein